MASASRIEAREFTLGATGTNSSTSPHEAPTNEIKARPKVLEQYLGYRNNRQPDGVRPRFDRLAGLLGPNFLLTADANAL